MRASGKAELAPDLMISSAGLALVCGYGIFYGGVLVRAYQMSGGAKVHVPALVDALVVYGHIAALVPPLLFGVFWWLGALRAYAPLAILLSYGYLAAASFPVYGGDFLAADGFAKVGVLFDYDGIFIIPLVYLIGSLSLMAYLGKRRSPDHP